MKRILVLMVFALSLTSQALVAQNPKVQIEENIVYKEGPTHERHILDVAYPENTERCPVVVWFHGGGLTQGKKFIEPNLKNSGFVTVYPNYRLYPEASVAEIIDDAAAAVAWVIKNIYNYGGEPSKVYVSGFSAGAYLTMMVGLNSTYLEKYGVDASSLAGLAPISGQMITHFTERVSRGMTNLQPYVDEMAPLYYVNKEYIPPILLITGDSELEMDCRYEENAYMAAILKKNGHEAVTLYQLEGMSHEGLLSHTAQILLIRWIKSHQ